MGSARQSYNSIFSYTVRAAGKGLCFSKKVCVRTHVEYNVLVLDIIVGLSREAANRTYAFGSVCYNGLSYMTVFTWRLPAWDLLTLTAFLCPNCMTEKSNAKILQGY